MNGQEKEISGQYLLDERFFLNMRIPGTNIVPAVETRGNAFNLFKVLYKVTLVLEAHSGYYIGNGPLLVKQENFSSFNALAGEIVHGRYTGMFFENTAEMMPAHCRLLCQLFKVNIL